MIKPIEITPLNTSQKLYFECENCEKKDVIILDYLINTDYEDVVKEALRDFNCPYCGEKL